MRTSFRKRLKSAITGRKKVYSFTRTRSIQFGCIWLQAFPRTGRECGAIVDCITPFLGCQGLEAKFLKLISSPEDGLFALQSRFVVELRRKAQVAIATSQPPPLPKI